MKRSKYRSFNDAKEFIRDLKLSGVEEWIKYCKSGQKPSDIPRTPEIIYKNNGWIGYGDFLGTGRLREYHSFEEAKKFVHGLKLKKQKDWESFCKSGKKPDDIPATPNRVYKNKWTTWGDFLGTGTLSSSEKNKQFRTFDSARKFAISLKLSGLNEWESFCKSGKKPDDIPSNPDQVYKRNNAWTSWGDFLGTGTIAGQLREYRSFEEARKFVHGLKLKKQKDWESFCKSGKNPDDIPSHPDRIYKHEGWGGYGDWLGTGTLSPRDVSKNYIQNLRDAKIEARIIAKELGLKSERDWKQAHREGKIPKHLPRDPWHVYHNLTRNKK